RPHAERLFADNNKNATLKKERLSTCPIDVFHSGIRRVSDLALQVKHNKRDELIIWTWIPGRESIVHHKVLAEFERRGFTGYRLRPATVRFRDGQVSNDYQELIVTGWAGIARPESGIRVVKSCPGCLWKEYSGLTDAEELIDWNQWTGEDFFIVWPMPNQIMITERVADFLLSHHVKSFEFLDLESVDPLIRNSGFTVAQLSDGFPEDLAVKYGRPLGLE